MRSDDTVILIPTKRPPPIATLVNYYPSGDHEVVIVADPDVYQEHKRFYRGSYNVNVVLGVRGMGPQIYVSYRIAAGFGYEWMFRVDDDLAPKTFVHRDGTYPSLINAMNRARECIEKTDTTLAGFMNGANRFWMSDGFKRDAGLVHGGAQIAKTTKHPEKYIDRSLPCFEDVYRSCAHRAEAGAVGRVCFIGFDKSKSVGTDKFSGKKNTKSSINIKKRKQEEAKKLVLDKWNDYVTCVGTRQIHGGKTTILNWRMKRHPEFVP